MVKLQKYIAVVCFIFIISSAVLLFADDDRLLISKERWDSLKEWQPDPQGVGEMPNVDFRNFLPSVGNQGFQHSCVGWAIAYACKTYLEVRDQGWQPDLSKRIFSPAFVYNQINRGINRGSNIERALKLLISDGCATLSTMPYRVGNWTSQPSGSARREAGKFRCKSYYPVKSGTLIRKALQQGHVVILSVRTDPVFCSGLFQIYTAREKRRGEAEVARNRRKSYGYHAMCVVGYDDIRRAFLVMNSWSKGWGKEGYCWIAYDVVKDVRRSERNFAQEAWILLDIQQKLDT